MSQQAKGIIFIVIFQFLIGLSPIFIKLVSITLPGSLFIFLRFGIAAVFFLLFIFFSKKLFDELKQLSLKKVKWLIFLGLFSSGLGSFLYVLSVRTIGASLTSIISNLEIPLGILFAVLFLKEKLTKQFIVTGIVILIGFYMVTIRQETISVESNTFLIGIAIAFLTAVIFGFSTILGKILLKENISPAIISLFRQGFGAIFGLMIALFSVGSFTPIITLSLKDWMLIIFTGIIISGVGFIFYYEALKRVEVKKISFFFIVSPIVSVGLGALTGETLNVVQWAGVFIILTGIAILLQLREKTPLPEKEAE